jgi:hypothetical protein
MKTQLAAAGIVLSALLAGTAGPSFAQGTASPQGTASQGTGSQGPGTEANMAVVDGRTWANSTPDERASFLLGMASIVNSEYQAGKSDPSMAGPSARIVRAMRGVTLGDLQHRVDTWYAAHPDQESLPVASVIWRNWIQPNAEYSGSSNAPAGGAAPAQQPILGRSHPKMGMSYQDMILYTSPPGSPNTGG